VIIALGGQPTKQSQSLPNQPMHIASLRPSDLNSLALFVVLIFGMSASADRAYHSVLGMWAAHRFVAKHPAMIILGDEGVGLILPWLCGAVTKQERGVSHNVLKTRTIRIKESNGDRPMMGIGVSGHQPVGVTFLRLQIHFSLVY